MDSTDRPLDTDLLLIGGGHSHLFVLRQFAMHPLPGLRITLVSRDLNTPYSGMLPGYIAGHYRRDEAHIDLLPLARHAGARVIHEEIVGIDAANSQVLFASRPPLAYDLASVNIGSRPQGPGSADDRQFAVKPVDGFIDAWQRVERRLEQGDESLRLAIVGGGAGGVELALALQYRARRLSGSADRLSIALLTDRERLLPGHGERVGRIFTDILRRRSIEVHYRHRVEKFADGLLHGDFDPPLAADYAVWVTQAAAPGWLRDSGLALDERGFIEVDACLQSRSHDNLFAAGDIAAVSDHPRPKSGVFAVRQGLPLARNLRRWLQGRPPRPFMPQRRFLSLISTGDRHAVASRGGWTLQGRWCWWLKDLIDRRFVRRFSELPKMTTEDAGGAELAPMRCGGCGSKVGSELLEGVLDEIRQRYGMQRDSGTGHADDAAILRVPPGVELIQSIDHFRSFVDDAYLFGRIAANHALGDLYAMGIDAHSALVIANVVFASEDQQRQDLYQLLCGVAETLRRDGVLLAGGHSGEASQMSCGLSVNGFARPGEVLLKSGMRPGDALVLTRGLGSGVIFAAEMRARARSEWVDAALDGMLTSSRDASRCLRRFAASACTDVTGFGLAGHLHEMARASHCAVELRLDQLPLYTGAAELAAAGIHSSLQPQNIRIRHAIDDPRQLSAHPAYPLLFDPQTAGGLLASVAAGQADACVAALRELGYADACRIGRVVEAGDSAAPIRLVSA
jgi:selenide,water dikinase